MGRAEFQIKGQVAIEKTTGQASVEFVFAMIAVIFLIYGLVRVFGWAGMDLAERAFVHEQSLTNGELSPQQQLNPDFYRPRRINAVYQGNMIK